GPGRGKGAPGHRTERRKDGGATELHHRLNETRTDSDTGAADAERRDSLALAPHRRGLATRSVPSDAQGRGTRSRWAKRGGVCDESRGQPRVAARSREVRALPSAARPACAHPEREWRHAAPGHPNLRSSAMGASAITPASTLRTLSPKSRSR